MRTAARPPYRAPRRRPSPLAGFIGRSAARRCTDVRWAIGFSSFAVPEDGCAVSVLVKASGMSRPTPYRRRTGYVNAGRITQVRRGRYRATSPNDASA